MMHSLCIECEGQWNVNIIYHVIPQHGFSSEPRDARMDIKRRCELKEHEFFHLVEEALKTADPVKARLVFEKRKELSDLVREYKANSGYIYIFQLSIYFDNVSSMIYMLTIFILLPLPLCDI